MATKVMDYKSSLTIILTLKDRVGFTYRWMQYMNDVRCPHHILIADGGNDCVIEQHLGDHRNYPLLNYEYIRFRFDDSTKTYVDKLVSVLGLVRTDYVLLADNDDFYLLHAIPEILFFLDTNPEYVGGRGQHLSLSLADESGPEAPITKGDWYHAIGSVSPSIEYATAIERVEALCSNIKTYDYYMNWYSIFRTPVLEEVWRRLGTIPTQEVIVLEMLCLIFVLCNGKLKIFPENFYVRQVHPEVGHVRLVVGNEFLERMVIGNEFVHFGQAVDGHLIYLSASEKDRVLRAIAGWLEVFVSNIFLLRQRSLRSKFRKLERVFKSSLILQTLFSGLYLWLFNRLTSSGPRKRIRLPLLERYILKL